jgi:hypothetical protein
MTSTEADVRAELRALAERYASGVDHREVDTLLGAFHADATLAVYSPPDADFPRSLREGHEGIGGIPAFLEVYARTFHLLGQSIYNIGDGVATGEVYCVAHHLVPNGHGGTDRVMYIRYEDTYRPGADGAWKIALRRVMVQWTETRAVNPPDQ